jgi:hypothetical protein
MFKHFLYIKLFLLLAIGSSCIVFSGCSPKIKVGIWAKRHQDAALSLGTWAANNPADATALLVIDCNNRKQFKKKITDALNGSTEQQSTKQGYDVRQHNYHYGNVLGQSSSTQDGFADWCRKYPKAAKKLRGHAKALCKAGLGILNGTYKIN